jgi:hypothetical protein
MGHPGLRAARCAAPHQADARLGTRPWKPQKQASWVSRRASKFDEAVREERTEEGGLDGEVIGFGLQVRASGPSRPRNQKTISDP